MGEVLWLFSVAELKNFGQKGGSIIVLYKMIQDDWGKIFRALRNIPNLDEIFFPK